MFKSFLTKGLAWSTFFKSCIYIMFSLFFHTSQTVARPPVRLAGPSHFSGSMITNANSGRSGCSACGK